MKLTFQADADLDPDIVTGLLRQEPAIDFRSKAGVIADGTPDSEVLRIAARLLDECWQDARKKHESGLKR